MVGAKKACENSSATKLELKRGYNLQCRIPFHNIMYSSFLVFAKMFVFLMFLGAITSPNGTKCSPKLRGTSDGDVNEFSPYSICLNLGYSFLMPCASSGHVGFTPKLKKHFASCKIIQNCYSSTLFKLNYLLLCEAVHPNPSYDSDKRYKFSC